MFVYLSAFSKVSNNYHLNCLIGSISAALKTNIVGNSETVKIKDIKDTLKKFFKKLVMNILITGGAGFIGSHVSEYFIKKNVRS